MSALILTVIITAIVACLVWLALGSKFSLGSPDDNGLLNLLAYAAILAPFIFAMVYFGVEKL